VISDAALSQLKADRPCADVAASWVRLRRHGKGMIGPCPICSRDRQSKTDGRFEIKDRDGWVCAACQAGGDVIALVMQVEGLDFKGAVERLGGVRDVDPAEVVRRDSERAAAAARRDNDAAFYRERERGNLYDIWNHALPPAGTAVEAYLKKRAVVLPPDAHKRLRCIPDMPYFAHGGKDAPVIRRCPAMVAPVVRADGKFSALHFTWLDLDELKGKAKILDPETGEALPSKKVRGSKAGGTILLVKPPQPATRGIYGEGIETTLSVWHALASLGHDLSSTEFRSTVDMGNLAGKATGTIPHPTLKDAAGRARRVPGPDADLAASAITVPTEIKEVVLLGDGDSDRVVTACALYRAQTRIERACNAPIVRVAWAPSSVDFNDLLMAV
jgi:CHC2 zinc finger